MKGDLLHIMNGIVRLTLDALSHLPVGIADFNTSYFYTGWVMVMGVRAK